MSNWPVGLYCSGCYDTLRYRNDTRILYALKWRLGTFEVLLVHTGRVWCCVGWLLASLPGCLVGWLVVLVGCVSESMRDIIGWLGLEGRKNSSSLVIIRLQYRRLRK
ncbi:hypothetical protein L873DRAFT_1811849 [Choiromyces venosus 120613-1]|uniref:Uncharacterized protein n=1 Tax=Choiromyces venosus 120613-1 TaxID=1336337 RepID=A0A3N4JGU7_9PEZI|nr:hypothetical protein L873DRAFT_1811849 [Choiromyces venosus 120613-1]